MEMLCRMCEKASFPPYMGMDDNGLPVVSDMTLSQRQSQPLYIKLENALPILRKSVCDKSFLKEFKKPKKDPKKNLYILKGGKFF